MIVIGLTGSIAMGKSTVGAMLETLGIPVHDADACVHSLLKKDNPAREQFSAAFPYYEFPDIYEIKTREIKRDILGKLVFSDSGLRKRLEDVLHPLVQAEQQEFIRKNAALGMEIVCLDIPLLFETGSESRVDYVMVASAPYNLQKKRALQRPNMSEEKFVQILSRQMSDKEKCDKADYVIKTGLGKAYSMKMLKEAVSDIKNSTH